jgi:hypothetical protein
LAFQRNGATANGPCPDPAANGSGDRDEQVELRALTDALMTEISRLSGQQYVDQYANRSRAR